MVEKMNDPSRSCGTCESKVAGAGGCEVSAEANPLRKLLAVIWASIGIDVLSCLIGVVDVREYYELGRFMYAVNEVCSIALSAWLAIGITNRKNWARVTFIVYGLLCLSATFLCYFGLEQGGGGNAWVPFLDTANLTLTVYCVTMLFTKKVSGLFFKSANDKKRIWAFCGVFFVYLVFSLVFLINHELSDEYRRDRAKAAEQGLAKTQYDYSSGDGVPKDKMNAMKVWLKAAKENLTSEKSTSRGRKANSNVRSHPKAGSSQYKNFKGKINGAGGSRFLQALKRISKGVFRDLKRTIKRR